MMTFLRVRKAVVAGAGIGGLATAIALRSAGFEVQVVERVREMREIGAAVVVWPNGTRALRALGVSGSKITSRLEQSSSADIS